MEINLARKEPKFAELLSPRIIWSHVDQAFLQAPVSSRFSDFVHNLTQN
jgi:hypothetical protein